MFVQDARPERRQPLQIQRGEGFCIHSLIGFLIVLGISGAAAAVKSWLRQAI